MCFKLATKNFIKAVVKKILAKSPMKAKLLRNLQWLDPEVLRRDHKKSLKQFEETMACLVSLDKMKAEHVDILKQEFSLWLVETDLPPFLASQRLDMYWVDLIEGGGHKFWSMVKLLLALSHGQAQIERGFSVNKETMSQNMTERTLVMKRVICDHVASVGGLEKVEVTPGLLAAASSARAAYRFHLEQTKEEEKNRKRKREGEDRFSDLDSLKSKKQKLQSEVCQLEASADRLAEKAEHLNSIKFIVESNALRSAAKGKKRELEALFIQMEDTVKVLAAM